MPTWTPPAELPARFSLAEAGAAGVTRHTLRALVAGGDVRVVSRDVYAAPFTIADGEPWRVVRAEHLERCRDWLARRPGHVASHQTAAVVHGLELSIHPAMDVHLTSVDSCPRSRRCEGVQLHHADSVVNHTTEVDGIRVTTITRTVADVLRTARAPNSVALLDDAIRTGRTNERAVRAVLDSQRRWRGRPRAVEAMTLADPRRETWLESYSFVTLHELGIPLPMSQVDVLDHGFHFVGRVDGVLGTVFLEADGQGKYVLAARETGISEEESRRTALRAQELRQASVERTGLVGVRWTTEEIRHAPEGVAARVRAALRRASLDRFTGWLRRDGRIFSPSPPDIPV